MSTDRIERDILIDAPAERVWALITDAEHLGSWFGDAGAEIDLRPGGRLELRWEEHGTVNGRVERVDPPHAFSFRWLVVEAPRGDEPEAGNSTLVEFTLTPEGSATRLAVAESGFDSLDYSDEERLRRYEGNVEGWGIELGHLAEHAGRLRV